MKRTFAKRGMMPLLVGFFLFGVLMLTAGKASAQTYNWMQPAQAVPVLLTEAENQKVVVNANTPGTPAYENAMVHVLFYHGIINEIDGGNGVGGAVQAAFDKLTTGSSVYSVSLSKSAKQALFNDAVGKLTL